MKVLLTPHQQKFIGEKMKGGGYLSRDEVIREALRVYELIDQDDASPELESALRQALRSSRKKFKPGHFVSLVSQSGRRAIAA